MFYGADTEALRQHASAVRSGGSALEVLGQSLAQRISAVEWVGADAEAFREHGLQIMQQLRLRADRLAGSSDELDTHAEEQDSASDGEGAAQAGPGAEPGDDNAFWFWEDGWSAPWSSKADLRNDIPLDVDQFSIDAMGQEGFDNCSTVAALGTMAEADPQFLADHVRQVDGEHYEVDLFIDGEWKTVTVEDKVHASGSRDDGKQNWVTLYEQALIQEGILTEDGDYSQHYGGAGVFEAVTGAKGYRHVGSPGQYAGVKEELSYDDVVNAHEQGRPVVLGTKDDGAVSSDGSIHLAENHAYAVESVNPDGSITIVNTWGEDANYGGEDGTYRITLTQEQYRGIFDDGMTGPPPEDWDRTGG